MGTCKCDLKLKRNCNSLLQKEKEMKTIVTLEIDLSKASPSIIKEQQWADLTSAELLEAVADWLGDSGNEVMFNERFEGCAVWVKGVRRDK